MILPGELWSRLRKDGTEQGAWITLSQAELNAHGFYQLLMLRVDTGTGETRRFNANGFLNPKSWRREA